jgi:hypothetical protein
VKHPAGVVAYEYGGGWSNEKLSCSCWD